MAGMTGGAAGAAGGSALGGGGAATDRTAVFGGEAGAVGKSATGGGGAATDGTAPAERINLISSRVAGVVYFLKTAYFRDVNSRVQKTEESLKS